MEDQMTKMQKVLNTIAKGGEKAEELKTWLKGVADEKTGLIGKLLEGTILHWGEAKDIEYIKRSLNMFRYTRKRLLGCSWTIFQILSTHR